MYRQTQIMAGFEVAMVDGGRHCTASSSGHLPDFRMASHYGIAHQHGIRMIRDGLPWWGPEDGIRRRLAMARQYMFDVVWVVDHWWRHPHPRRYAERVVEAVNSLGLEGPFRFCFVELSMEGFAGESFERSVEQAHGIASILRAGIADTRMWTSEPANHPHEIERQRPLAEIADVVGLNFFPHDASWPLADALIRAHQLFGKPVAIMETSLNPQREEIWNGLRIDKAEWLRRCLREVEIAKAAGVEVPALSWHPFVDSRPWHDPQGEWWPHGLIRGDLSVDPILSSQLANAAHFG